MHCVVLTEIANLVSQNAPAIVYRGSSRISAAALSEYWVGNRSRLDQWHQAMARYQSLARHEIGVDVKCWWRDHLPMMEEIIVADMVSRVVACMGAAMDERHGNEEVSPITHAVFLSNVDATNRVQRLMLQGKGVRVHEVVRINRIRKSIERWTDLLLGRMHSNSFRFRDYAFVKARASTHAMEHRERAKDTDVFSQWLITAAMRQSLARILSEESAFPQFNRRVASSVIGLFAPDLFDQNTCTLQSKWLHLLKLDHLEDSTQAAGFSMAEAPSEPSDADALNDPAPQEFDDLRRWNLN